MNVQLFKSCQLQPLILTHKSEFFIRIQWIQSLLCLIDHRVSRITNSSTQIKNVIHRMAQRMQGSGVFLLAYRGNIHYTWNLPIIHNFGCFTNCQSGFENRGMFFQRERKTAFGTWLLNVRWEEKKYGKFHYMSELVLTVWRKYLYYPCPIACPLSTSGASTC